MNAPLSVTGVAVTIVGGGNLDRIGVRRSRRCGRRGGVIVGDRRYGNFNAKAPRFSAERRSIRCRIVGVDPDDDRAVAANRDAVAGVLERHGDVPVEFTLALGPDELV